MDILRLVAVNHFEHVIGLAFDGGEERTAGERVVGAVENEVVGEVGGSDGEVGAWFFGPLVG